MSSLLNEENIFVPVLSARDQKQRPGTAVPDLLDTIMSRRSVSPKRLLPPGPDERELARIVATAMTAPDHGKLRPWRFIHIPDQARHDLARLFGTAKKEEFPQANDVEIERAQGRAFNAPTLLAVILRTDTRHPRVTVEEQLVSLGAALQNILLSAHALGYAAMITSGRKVQSVTLQSAFCANPEEQLIGFVSIGTPSAAPRPRAAASLHDHFSMWV